MTKNLNWFQRYLNEQFDLLTEINNDLASEKINSDKWSRKEILGHLIDSANVNYNRFINAVSKDNLIFESYPQDDWVELQFYNDRDWNELVDLWKLLNLHIIVLVNNIPEDKKANKSSRHNFDKICWKQVKGNEKSSLDYLIKDYIGHLKHHLNQIYNY